MDVNSRDPLQNIIPFRIKGAEIGRFDSSGNLKIGTTTTTAPTVRLDISGGAARVNSGAATSTALTTTGRIGINVAAPTADLDVSGVAKIGNVNIGSNPLYAFTSHTFTNAGATGRTGPTLSTVRTTYTNAGATWAATNVNMTTNGIQLWTVPVTGRYTIRAKGAAGFIGTGLSNARGIDIQTTTTLIKGEVIKILVGQRGSGQGAWGLMGSGGGGSFVVREISTPIIIAGGGGGTGGGNSSNVNSDASRETYGMDGGTNTLSGGNNGQGGKGGQGSGGGGFLQDGFAGINNYIPPSSFLTGGEGGVATGGSGVGGFGGGGYAQDTTGYQTGGGGGGGYSGGGGGGANDPGGGGGSFAISTMTVNGYNTDHGSVTITLISTSSDFDISGVARMSALSATSTALTTVGRIGVNIPDPMADLEVAGVARLTASSATATALTTTGRIGVNTATPTVDLEVNGLAKLGNVNIVPLYVFISHTFTNAGTTGRLGPTLTTVRTHSDYASVNWAQNNSYLSMTSDNGIQLWTVPLSGNYTIRAKGAAGLDTRGGKGRDIQLTTTLAKGEVIRILVGQQGTAAGNFSSGGGGTFVVRGTDTPIIVAGGGGGRGNVIEPFSHASITTTGQTTPFGYYGGGSGLMPLGGGGDSGVHGAGGGFNINNTNQPRGGVSFTAGGLGGQGDFNINGGFGGGGGWLNYVGGAGGGGYSGGGSGGQFNEILGGGGGGSFGITTLTDFGAINTGHGSVTITLTTPSVALEVIGVAVVTGSSATSTALTTTGRIGVNTAAPSVDLDVVGAVRVTTSSVNATALTTVGRIGVNTATPTVDLDVVGQGNILYGLILGSSTNNTFIGHLAQKLSIYHDTNAKIFLRYGNSEGMLIGNYSGGSFITHRETTGELEFYTEQNTPIVFRTQKNINSANRLTITGAGNVGIGTAAPTVALDVSGAANVTGSMTINGCTPRSSVTYTSNLRANYSIPAALRGGNFITNKVYFSIRVLAGNRPLYLKPNGSASTFHSFIQQTASSVVISGVDEAPGFKMCEIMGSAYGTNYTPPSFTHIVGEFTIIRNTVGHTSTISSVTGYTTRIYGTLVQYGNHYMQKWDFQGQAVQGAADDSYDRIDLFQFLTSDATKDADGGNSVAVTIEG